MIPYVDFASKRRGFAPENPFVTTNKPLVVFIDRASFDSGDDLEFLLRQADGEKLFIISTEKEGNAQLAYIPRDDDVLEFRVANLDGTGVAHHGITSLSQFKSLATASDFTRWATAEEIERAFIAAKTVENMDAHIFVTNDKFLLEHKDIGIIADSYPMDIADATALIGLVQRRRNNFKIVVDRRDGATITSGHGRWSFFWYGSRDLLPSAWRLVTGCAQMPDDKCRDLALAAISRTSNALKCRDHIHEQVFLEQTNSSTEDAIFYLDYYLISFVAAFDVLARVADEIYQPTTAKGKRIKPVTWRGKDWLKGLANQDAALAGLMAPKAFNRDVLDFIASLRNYIHAEGLQGAMHSKNGKTAPLLLHIPKSEVPSIAAIIKRLGGGSWIVDRPRPDVMFLELGDLVERITPLAIEALESTMKAIDITKVPGHDPSKVQTKAPEKWLSKAELADIRRLLGI